MVLAFIIPFSMGWDQASTAATTVMLIAATGSVRDSIYKGFLRLVGTLIGAVIGLTLIMLMPQDRLLYLLSVSIIVSIIVYLYYAYQGDSTAFMLTAMMLMMVFNGGDAEGAFIYGIDRTFMTLFAIVLYTLISVFIWPHHDNDKLTKIELKHTFVWGDLESFKSAIQVFLIFWFTTYLWITFNPPGGFMFVVLATLLSLLTSFSPLKPMVLITLFTLGFIFAIFMYVAVLPNLESGYALAIFLFVYAFIAYYVINPKMSIFFLLGLFTMGISNEMHYNFDVFLMTLLMFYLFLSVLILFYYFPFSTKAEHLYVMFQERYFKYLKKYLDSKGKSDFYAFHLLRLVPKIKLWSSKIDFKHFDERSKEPINELIRLIDVQDLTTIDLEQVEQLKAQIDWKNLKESRF